MYSPASCFNFTAPANCSLQRSMLVVSAMERGHTPLTSTHEAANTTAFQVAAERLRIMVLTGQEGSAAFCNHVARTVELGAEDESVDGDDSDDGDGQGNEFDGGDEQGVESDDNQDDESGANSPSPHLGVLAAGAVACGLVEFGCKQRSFGD